MTKADSAINTVLNTEELSLKANIVKHKIIYSTCFLKHYELYEHQKQSFADVHQIRFFKNVANFTGKHLCWSLF